MSGSATAGARVSPGTPRCVLMTADAVGGVWDYALQLSRGLTTHGVDVTLATLGPLPRSDQRAAAAAIDGLRLVSRALKLEWMADPWDDVDRAGAWLLDLEEQIGPDVIHLNGYSHGCLPWSAPVVVAGHSCVCSWWEAVKGCPAPQGWEPYRRRIRAGLQGADAVVSPTRAMLALLQREYGTRGGRVIPNGRSADDFPPGIKEPFVFSAGRLWDEAKNVALLAAAAPALPWPVYVAGDTAAERGAHGGIDAFEAGKLRPVGRLPSRDIAAWLGRAAIYALPAKYEPFGLTALEAALAGCALVLGDIPSLREIWEDAAWFVPPDDPAALAHAIRALAADPASCRDAAARARARALGFPADRMTRAYLDVYASLRRSPVPQRLEETPCVS
jgi:glycogen(starch) synthase